MRRLATVGAGALLALSAACGAQTSTGSAPQPTATLPSDTSSESAPPSSSEPQLPDGATPPGAKLITKVDVSKLPEGYPRKVWTEGDGSRIGLTAQEGGCGKASVEIAEQNQPDKVVLTLIETTPAKEQMCTMDMRYPAFTVALNAPLGDRTVVLDYQQRKS